MSVSLSKTNSDGSKFSGTGSVTAVPAIHTGATGAAATPPVWTFATPTSVAAGGTPTLSLTGTYPTQEFTFGLVGGEAGGFGAPTITTGSAGSSASILHSGPDTAKVFAFTIPRGDVGAQGITGNTGTAAGFGTPTIGTGAAGSSASISSSGPDTAKVFAFTIPRGDVGVTGDTGTACRIRDSNSQHRKTLEAARAFLLVAPTPLKFFAFTIPRGIREPLRDLGLQPLARAQPEAARVFLLVAPTPLKFSPSQSPEGIREPLRDLGLQPLARAQPEAARVFLLVALTPLKFSPSQSPEGMWG